MWGKRLAAMLAIYTGKGVAPELNLRERIYHIQLHQVRIRLTSLALKPIGDVTKSPKQGYQWPKNGRVSNKNKKRRNNNPAGLL